MSDPYEGVKGGRLAFKGGDLATRSKAIDKNKKKKKKTRKNEKDYNTPNTNQDGEIETQTLTLTVEGEEQLASASASASGAGGEVAYTIDAAKKMKYEQLFPVEAKKFGYEPKTTNFNSVEDALDHRVKKKADRYCK